LVCKLSAKATIRVETKKVLGFVDVGLDVLADEVWFELD
jgi:hypothetical protein